MDKNEKIQRRSFLMKTGLVSAGAISAAVTQNMVQPREAKGQETESSWPFPFTELDPELAAERGYEAFYQGACCYGAVQGLLTQWKELMPEKFESIPAEMFKYGEGGVAGWGSTCGTINGVSAMINLVCEMEDAKVLINELLAWYADTELPQHVPEGKEAIVTSASKSPLCHVSVSKWCNVSGAGAVSAERKERCGRLTGDVAKKTALLLNAHFGEQFEAEHDLSPVTKDCMGCHGSDAMNTTLGKMECTPCHLPENHPVPISNWNKF